MMTVQVPQLRFGHRHVFGLVPTALSSLQVLEPGQARAALAAIIRGEQPGWYCAVCGISIAEFHQVAAIIGTDRAMSALVVQCSPRPHVVRLLAQQPAAGPPVLYTELYRMSATVADDTSGMLDAIESNQWVFPVVTDYATTAAGRLQR